MTFVACTMGQAIAAEPIQAPASPVPTTPQASITLEDLLGKFAGMSGLQADFREEKRMALLAAPLVNEGKIYFVPGGGKKPRLARHTSKPASSVVIIDGAALRLADDAGREEISLDKSPPVRLFVDSFVKIFAGDREALATMYSMELQADGQRWTLKLRPKVAPLDRLIERVEIAGEGIVIATMRVIEVGGDESITTFSAVDPKRNFSDKELQSLFSLPAAPAKAPVTGAPAGR